MKRYRMKAHYVSVREIVVQVSDDCADPTQPSEWIEVEAEHESELYLHDVPGDAVEVDDQHREIEGTDADAHGGPTLAVREHLATQRRFLEPHELDDDQGP